MTPHQDFFRSVSTIINNINPVITNNNMVSNNINPSIITMNSIIHTIDTIDTSINYTSETSIGTNMTTAATQL